MILWSHPFVFDLSVPINHTRLSGLSTLRWYHSICTHLPFMPAARRNCSVVVSLSHVMRLTELDQAALQLIECHPCRMPILVVHRRKGMSRKVSPNRLSSQYPGSHLLEDSTTQEGAVAFIWKLILAILQVEQNRSLCN